ncbi:histidine kinase [Taibaiella chishuiensis]|uniref:Histidine kinase n=2 Tax=Taibaiella chishuiensis TaxID=1434707 RepID=A0A2P8D7F9_9BACT|nr:histidine kinase [Taibaiella chishuiensis]
MISNSNDMLLRRFFFQWFTFSLYAFFYWRSTVDKNKAKREKLELENATLRAQINPHFIINSLDFFRIQTMETAPQVSEGLFWFMKTLRAGITTPEQDGKIKFKIEMEAIEGTINTFKLRFPDLQLEENLVVEDKDAIRILPHIILPFVENAFKHGLYTDENHKIQIALFANPDKIKMTVKNKKDKRIKDNSSGIGLRYVKKHLASGYPGKYDLIINDTEDLYTVDLSVQLN